MPCRAGQMPCRAGPAPCRAGPAPCRAGPACPVPLAGPVRTPRYRVGPSGAPPGRGPTSSGCRDRRGPQRCEPLPGDPLPWRGDSVAAGQLGDRHPLDARRPGPGQAARRSSLGTTGPDVNNRGPHPPDRRSDAVGAVGVAAAQPGSVPCGPGTTTTPSTPGPVCAPSTAPTSEIRHGRAAGSRSPAAWPAPAARSGAPGGAPPGPPPGPRRRAPPARPSGSRPG